ncbi:hypothetical protein VTN96DRAFT_1941 [Rasamsonia emersonii]
MEREKEGQAGPLQREDRGPLAWANGGFIDSGVSWRSADGAPEASLAVPESYPANPIRTPLASMQRTFVLLVSWIAADGPMGGVVGESIRSAAYSVPHRPAHWPMGVLQPPALPAHPAAVD